VTRLRPFLLARAGHALTVLVVIVTLVFVLFRLTPGDPFLARSQEHATEEEHAAFRARWGYDRPIAVQYVKWVGNFVSGDFGWSHSAQRPVREVLATAFVNSTLLMIPAFVLGWLGAVALGTWQAFRQGRWLARASETVAIGVLSIPDFVMALAALWVFAFRLRLAPSGGMVDVALHDSLTLAGRTADVVAHLALPALTLAVVVMFAVSRYHRAAVLGVLHEDYVRTARASGAAESDVVRRHVLPNALGPAIAVAGILLPGMFAGGVFVEKVFAWPGMGRTLVDAVLGRDFELVQAIVVVSTVAIALGSALADIVAVTFNPRVQLDT